MRKSSALSLVALVVISMLGIAREAKANLITNGDFSTGTLEGWDPNSSGIVTDYENIPSVYKNTWDLSSWNSRMDGNFLFVETSGNVWHERIKLPLLSNTFSLSVDYAVAWEVVEPIDPYTYDYGYFYVQTGGVTLDGRSHSLSYTEIDWGPYVGLEKDIATGTLFTENFIQYQDLAFSEIMLDFTFLGFKSLHQVIGIDNVNLSPVPVPESSTLLLLGVGLVCFAGASRKRKQN